MNRHKFIGGAVLCAAAGLWIGASFAGAGEARSAEVNVVCAAELQVKCVLLPGTYVINSRGDHCPKGGICFPNFGGRDDASFDFHARQAIFVTLEGLVTPHGVAGTVIKMGHRPQEDAILRR